MKKILLTILLMCYALFYSQGKSISLIKKSTTPIELLSGKKLSINDDIRIGLGSNQDGNFKFIQMLNNFNEPVNSADSRASMMKQKIKFFKEQDGVVYVFTKYFVINIEAAIKTNEVEL